MFIQEIIKNLVNKMGFDCQIEASAAFINVQVINPGLLIGQNGENISALQHLTKLIIIKNSKTIPQFTLDINNYRQQKTEILKNLAKDSACRANLLKKEIVLKPMSAYERRVVHLELANIKNIATISIGDEPNRRIVIRPA